MITPGLVSITFRPLAPREITELCVRAGLQSIEWGGDVHVPPSNEAAAREVRSLTADAGLSVAAYGSYFRIIAADGTAPDFEPVLASAAELGAPTVRVWAGTKDSEDVSASDSAILADRLHTICDQAAAAKIRVALEFHGGTYTNTADSTLRLLEAADHPNLDTLWQPPVGMSQADSLESLEACLARTSDIHVFHWHPTRERQPLAVGADRWASYFAKIAQSPTDRHALLEFVKDESPDQLVADAATLRAILGD